MLAVITHITSADIISFFLSDFTNNGVYLGAGILGSFLVTIRLHFHWK